MCVLLVCVFVYLCICLFVTCVQHILYYLLNWNGIEFCVHKIFTKKHFMKLIVLKAHKQKNPFPTMKKPSLNASLYSTATEIKLDSIYYRL